jgi:type IV pilus assembly protein PilN
MIRINLLAVERTTKRAASTTTRAAISPAQKVTFGASLILLSTVLGIGWWFWSLRTESARLEAEIATAEVESQRLRSVLAQVQKFEARKAQLQQRVTLIEQLRKGQSGPVHLLDEVSKSVPDRLWLITMAQNAADFTIEGQTTSLTSLSDFVSNLENSNWFKRPVEILDSTVTPNPQTGDMVRFTIKASFNNPDLAPKPPVAPRPPGAPAR